MLGENNGVIFHNKLNFLCIINLKGIIIYKRIFINILKQTTDCWVYFTK